MSCRRGNERWRWVRTLALTARDLGASESSVGESLDGEMLGEDGLLRILRLMGAVDPAQLIGRLLAEVGDRFPENLSHEDVTVIVVRANRRKPAFSFADKLGALLRLSRSWVRSLDPRAERAPLPDLEIANIGGAIIPALARRWRASKSGRRSR